MWTAKDPEIQQKARFIFLHVPKTAGTSLRNALCERFPECRHIENGTLLLSDLDRCDFVTGHFFYEKIVTVAPEIPTITMIRNPVERFLSAVKHSRKVPKSEFHLLTPAQWHMKFLPLPDFLTTEYAIHEGRMQRYMLKWSPHDTSLESSLDLLRSGKVAFGIVEKPNRSLALLSRYLGCEPISISRDNASPSSIDIAVNLEATLHLRTMLTKLFAREVEFYDRAVELFEKRTRDL